MKIAGTQLKMACSTNVTCHLEFGATIMTDWCSLEGE